MNMQILCPLPKQCQAGAGGNNLPELRTPWVPSLRSSPWSATPKVASGSTGNCCKGLWVVEVRELSLECIAAWWASLMVPPWWVPTGGVMRHHGPTTASILMRGEICCPAGSNPTLNLLPPLPVLKQANHTSDPLLFFLLPWPLTLIVHLTPLDPDRLACCWPLPTV